MVIYPPSAFETVAPGRLEKYRAPRTKVCRDPAEPDGRILSQQGHGLDRLRRERLASFALH